MASLGEVNTGSNGVELVAGRGWLQLALEPEACELGQKWLREWSYKSEVADTRATKLVAISTSAPNPQYRASNTYFIGLL